MRPLRYIFQKVFLFVLLFSFLACVNIYAQAPSLDAVESEALDLKVSSLEQSYDSQIYLLLANYFDRKKFFVDVAINAELIEEIIETPIPRTTSTITTQQPILMPGLPFLPEENIRQIPTLSQTADESVNRSTIRTLRLINLNVSIYADSSFKPQEIEFMRLLTGIAAKTNDARGDVINIAQIPIPDVGSKDPIIVRNEPKEPESLLASSKQYIPGFILLFLFGLIVFLSQFFSKSKERMAPIQTRETIKNDFNINELIRPYEGSRSSGAKERDISLEVDEVIESFFNKQQEIALLFEYWIDDDPENGAKKAAEVLNSIDSHLLRTLKNNLQPENYLAIQEISETLPHLPSEKKHQIIRSFNDNLNSRNTSSVNSKKNGHITLFKFLDHINDRQTIELLNDEGYQTGALIIDYLPDEKAARVLDKLDKNRTANIMLKMASLDSIPYQLQTEISSKLFDKAMDMVDKEKEEQYGAENILKVLDKLPLKDQQEYIDQLKATNAVVGEIVQSQFITIDQVLTITDDVIKKGVQDITTATLLDAVIGLNPKLIDKILSVRPNREQKLIKLELDELGETERDTNYAKSKMMASIRQAVLEDRKVEV